MTPPQDADLAVGPGGLPPRAPLGLDAFRFRCPSRPGVIQAAVSRALAVAAEVTVEGLFLDRIRWPSPSVDPVAELACFCAACRGRASADGLDLGAVAGQLAILEASADGRRTLLRALLQGGGPDPLDRFLAWRAKRMTDAVLAVGKGLRAAGYAVALDVFTPSLAFAVGQRIHDLSVGADWVKSMTYLSAWGPAAIPFELAAFGRWLAVGGEADPAALLTDLCGFAVPPLDRLRDSGLADDCLDAEIARMRDAAGSRAAIGLDVVAIPDVLDISDDVVSRRAAAIARAGLGIVASWDLLRIPLQRLPSLAAPAG